MKIICQFLCCLVGSKVKYSANKVDHITFALAAKAIEPIIHFHGRIPVIVKRAAHHAVLFDSESIIFSCLSRCDSSLNVFKDTQGVLLIIREK